jgi:hypothetical protein
MLDEKEGPRISTIIHDDNRHRVLVDYSSSYGLDENAEDFSSPHQRHNKVVVIRRIFVSIAN